MYLFVALVPGYPAPELDMGLYALSSENRATFLITLPAVYIQL